MERNYTSSQTWQIYMTSGDHYVCYGKKLSEALDYGLENNFFTMAETHSIVHYHEGTNKEFVWSNNRLRWEVKDHDRIYSQLTQDIVVIRELKEDIDKLKSFIRSFIGNVKAMRDAQKKYFKEGRTKEDLIDSKNKEKKVDTTIQKFQEKYQ